MGYNHLTDTFFWSLQGYLAGSADRVVFCCRWESLLQAATAFLQFTFLQAVFVNHWQGGKNYSKAWDMDYLFKKPEHALWESQVRRWWSCLQTTLSVPAFLAASLYGRQLPSLGWGSPGEDLGCLSCIFTGLVLLFWLWTVFQIPLKKSNSTSNSLSALEGEICKTNLVYGFWRRCMHVLTVGRERHKCFSVLPST